MVSVDGVEGCVTAERYILDYIGDGFPNVRDLILDEYGTACFCTEDFCNSELGEPDVFGEDFFFCSKDQVLPGMKGNFRRHVKLK